MRLDPNKGTTLRGLIRGLCLLLLLAPTSLSPVEAKRPQEISSDDDLRVVACWLPGKTRPLGRHRRVVGPRRLVRLTAWECALRGGEYEEEDLASRRKAFESWKARAEEGDLEAQILLGEIYERGFYVETDYARAAHWYRQAAARGDAQAQVRLALLHERGLGVERDLREALKLYREAAGLTGAIALDGRDEVIDLEEVERLHREVDELRSENRTLQSRLESLDRDLASARQELAEKERQTATLEDRSRQLEEALGREQQTSQRLGQLQAELASVRGELTSLRDDVARRRRQVADRERESVEFASRALSKSSRAREVEARLLSAGSLESDPAGTEDPAGGQAFPQLRRGPYYALIIGNGDYNNLDSLATPAHDAQALARLLESRYGFDKTVVLANASSKQMLVAFDGLMELDDRYNLLVFYSGHGKVDEDTGTGYWLPVDADPTDRRKWVSTETVAVLLKERVKALHVLVASDSCFTGELSPSSLAQLDPGLPPGGRRAWLERAADHRSRELLASGALKPVPAPGGQPASAFTRALLAALQDNSGVLEGRELFRSVLERLSAVALIPDYTHLPGHAMGAFLFVPGT